jgi:two-component system, NarL family, nitrate/nitrite response regulator NarL
MSDGPDVVMTNQRRAPARSANSLAPHREVVRREAGIGERLKILVVDDHEEFRKYVCALLQRQPRFAVVGEAANGVEAIDRARELQPDVVVLDINMPVLSGIEAAKQILLLAPNTQLIFLSQDESEMMIQGAMDRGASAYVVKASAATDLVRAVDNVVIGKKFFSPRRRSDGD